MRCSCGKDAVLRLFSGTKRNWGLCEDHLSRFNRHPLIYIDGVGSDGATFYKRNIRNIRYRKPYSDVVVSYPTSVEGKGTYTDWAIETLTQMADYMKALDVQSIPQTKPIFFIGSPFAVFANCLLMEPDRAEQLGVHFLLRPAVWIVVSNNIPNALRETVYLAHRTSPMTFVRFINIGKTDQSFWLPIKIAYDLWVLHNKSRKHQRMLAEQMAQSEPIEEVCEDG